MWQDYKYDIRKKVKSDEENIKANREKNSYTKYEEKIIEVLDLDKAVCGVED